MNRTLVEIEAEIAALLDMVDAEEGDEMSPDLVAELKAVVAERGAKLDRMAAMILRYEIQAAACREEAQALSRRARARNNVADRVRGIVREAMIASDTKRIECTTATFIVQPGRKSVVVEDETMLPEAFVETVTVPNKTAIKRALEQEEGSVPGAVLRDGDPILTIRR